MVQSFILKTRSALYAEVLHRRLGSRAEHDTRASPSIRPLTSPQTWLPKSARSARYADDAFAHRVRANDGARASHRGRTRDRAWLGRAFRVKRG